MRAEAVKAELPDIQSFRALFLQESNCQIRYDACHARGWADSYRLKLEDMTVGYGSVKGREPAERNSVFEFYVVPPFRQRAAELFARLLVASGAAYIECQSHDFLLSSMLYEFGHEIRSDVVMFRDHAATDHRIAHAVVRPRAADDLIFEHTGEPVGDYVLQADTEIVGTGGFMLHYNKPFADLYMEVRKDCWGRGYGAFLVQEIKKACYLSGHVPAARCSLDNKASRGALTKAGLRVCGFMLLGRVKDGAEAGGRTLA